MTRILVSRLLDGARFEEVERVSELCAERVHVTLAISLELNPFRKSPHQAGLDYVLRYLARKNSAVPSREHDYERMESPMILSVLAVCEAAVISQRWLPTVTKILNKFWGAEPVTYLGSMGGHLERYPFMRAVALKAVLMKSGEPPFRLFVPKVRAGREDENRELKH
ncbi:hypothetical protein OAL23_00465 [bacterium]|nr:hypothetical protein [bacterium]